MNIIKNKILLYKILFRNFLSVLRSVFFLCIHTFSEDAERKIFYREKLGFYDHNKKFDSSIIVVANGGEISGMNKFLLTLKNNYSNHPIIVAVENFDTKNIAKNAVTVADDFLFFPHDIFFSTQRFIEHTKPKLMLFLNTNFNSEIINQCYEKQIITGIVNGYFRKDLFLRKGAFNKIFRMKMNNSFDKMNFFIMQTKEDYETIKSVVSNIKKIHLTGFLKGDLEYAKVSKTEKKELMNLLLINEDDVVIIIGSTNFDEDIYLDAYKIIHSKISKSKLIIVPRYTDKRIDEIEKMIISKGFVYEKLSQIKNNAKKTYQVLLIDRPLSLAKLYSLGAINVIGKSFIPFEKIAQGGANIFEPAIHGKPVFFGTNMMTWKVYSKKIEKKFPVLEAKNSLDLAEKIMQVLSDKKLYDKIGNFLIDFVKKELTNEQEKIIKQYLQIINYQYSSRYFPPKSKII